MITVKLPFVRPAATVTCAGVVALVLLLDRLTGVPPCGAGVTKVNVQDVLDPPVNVVEEHTKDETPGCAI